MDIRQQIKQFITQYQTTGWLLLLMAGGLLFQALLFIIFNISGKTEIYDNLIRYLVLPANLNDLLIQPWSILTYPFFTLNASVNFLQILVNGLILWAFGRIHQQLLGERRTRRLVLLVIPIIGLMTTSISSFTAGPTFKGQTTVSSEQPINVPPPDTPSATTSTDQDETAPINMDSTSESTQTAIGEEGSRAANSNLFYPSGMIAIIMVLVISSISLVPGYPIQFFVFGQIKIVWVGIGLLVIEVMLALFFTPLAISIMIGGLLGFLHIYLLKRGKDVTEVIWSYYSDGKAKPKMTVKQGGVSKSEEQKKTNGKNGYERGGDIPEEIVDRILDKISAKGYESLSREEKEILFKASSQKDEPD